MAELCTMSEARGSCPRSEKIVAYISIVILILSLLPLMYVGRYNHPTGDDYFYGAETKAVWEESGSILKTIGTALEGVAVQYNRWQGTYSAMFLMYLPPNVFGEEWYGLVTTMILLSLTGGIFYLLKPVLCNLAGASKYVWCTISSVIALLCIQTVPSQGETFFWYNGSMYYTGFLAVTFYFWGLLIRYLLQPEWWKGLIVWLLAIFLAGGNYVSLLPCLILLFCLMVFLGVLRKKKEAVFVAITFVVMLGGFAVSAMAPGNALRQSGMWQIPAYMAILKSLLQGLRYAKAWIGIWWILGAVILLPVFWKSYGIKKYRFRFPLFVIGFVYGVFCAMSCPLFYTMNSTGPARAVSIVYYVFILATYFCYYYLLGYVYRILAEKQSNLYERIQKKSRKVVPAIACVGLVLLLGIQLMNGAFGNCSTVKAINILATGEGKRYHEEFLARMEIFHNPAIKDVVFEPYEHQPDMLFVGDLPANPLDVTNQKVAQYYGKDSVYVNY